MVRNVHITIGRGTPTVPPTSTMLIGLRTKSSVNATTPQQTTDWNNAVTTFGPMNLSRGEYYGGALPTTPTYFTPASVVQIPSFKKVTSSTTAWANSVRLPAKITFHHEPEGGLGNNDYANGAAFVAEFRTAYDAIKAANPAVELGMAAGGFQYRDAGRGADGTYIPPPDKCDFYGMDTYRTGDSGTGSPLGPIGTLGEFQNWYGLVKNLGRPLYITEYGRGWQNPPGTPSSWTLADKNAADAARPQLMKDDYIYLKGLGFKGILYWWNSNSPGDDWKFTDQPSIDALTWIAAQEVS